MINNNNNASKIDYSNEGLRSELESLRYELQTVKTDRELELIQHQEEVRAVEAKAEEKAKLADAAETDKRFLFEKQKSLGEELVKVKENAEKQKVGTLLSLLVWEGKQRRERRDNVKLTFDGGRG